jgi:hypothetical protein
MTRHRRYKKRPTEIFRNDLPRFVNSGQKIVPISRALSHAPRFAIFTAINGGEAMKSDLSRPTKITPEAE